jgi:hypothetical protein
MAALTVRPYTRRVTLPDDPCDAPPAELLDRARHLMEHAGRLIAAAEACLGHPARDRDEAERAARAAVETHEQIKKIGAAGQAAMYAAVRRLKGAGANKPEIRTTTGLTKSLVKWIVEDHAAARRARRRRQAAEDD